MGVKERLRKIVRPTWQEQQEKMARQETKRQANFERQNAKLDHQLKSLKRQEKLATKQGQITRIQKKLNPQPKGPAWDPLGGVMDALEPPKRKRR